MNTVGMIIKNKGSKYVKITMPAAKLVEINYSIISFLQCAVIKMEANALVAKSIT